MSDDLLSVSSPDSNVIYQDFDRAVNQIDYLNRQIVNLDQRNLQLQVRVDSLQIWQEHAIASQQAERENAIQARQEILALKQTNAGLQARCDALQSDKEALEAQAKQENETLRQEILALKQTNANLQACCDGLQSDKEALEADVLSSIETIQSLRESNSSLVSENTALERINDKAIEALDDTVQFIDENANLQACCNTAEKNIHGLSRQVGELTLENDRISTEAEQGRIETLVETQGVLDDMQDELNKVQDELERKDCENQNLREEIKFSEQNDRMKDKDISLLRYQVKILKSNSNSHATVMECETENSRKRLVSIAVGSSSVTPGPQEKRTKRATLSAITMNQDAATSSFFVDAESKAVASSAVAACSRGTDVGNSISLVPTQDSLRGEQATPTQSEGTKTIVLSDRASAKDAERRSLSAEEKNKALPIKLNELYQQYLEEKYGDEEYGWEHLITYPAPPTTKNGTPFLRLHFLLSQDCFRDLFGFLTTNTERNDDNGIILRRPLGLRALLEIMGTDVHSFRGVLIRNNFTHHPDNPKLLKPAHNTRQDFKFYHPEMHAGASAALVELRNIVPSYTVIPRRQNLNEVNFRTLFNDLCAEEDRDNRYETALSICRQLRNLDDMETILEKLNLLGKSKSDQAIMPILFHAVGLESNVQNQDAKEKLALRLVALRLDEGNGFVLQDDVYIKPYPNRFSLNRGQQTYRDAIAASASDFSQAKSMSSGKNAAMRQVREHVISRVIGRFMYQKSGVLQEIPEDELHKKVNLAFQAFSQKRSSN